MAHRVRRRVHRQHHPYHALDGGGGDVPAHRRATAAGGCFCQYGPFNYAGAYTSQSNARFDHWLRQQDPLRGIRDFEAVAALATEAGLKLEADHEMPANNRLLQWRKGP